VSEAASGTAVLVDTTVVEHVLDAALRRGGDFAEVFVEDRRATSASLDDGRVEELSSGRDRGAGVRVVVGETTGYAHTADLSEAGLLAAAEAAAAVARDAKGTRTVALTRSEAPRPYDVTIFPEDVAKGRKIELLARADEAARSAGAAVTQVSAGYGDSRRRILVANSDGVLVTDDQVRSRFSVSCVAVGDTGMQTGFETAAFTVGFELFDTVDVEDVAGAGGILFHEACGHGLEADHIAKDASVYVGQVGSQVASPLVTLVDDGTIGREWGTFAVDDEGHEARRNVLIENGVLTEYMWDYLRARQEGRQSSGNGRRQSYRDLPMVRMTNTFLIDGDADPDELLAQTPTGVYVAKLGGGQVNTTTGDFVFGTVEAYLIENGRLTEPLRDANLIGNGPEVLRRIDAVANDFATSPGTCGKDGQSVPVGTGQPTLRITGVTIGGTAGD